MSSQRVSVFALAPRAAEELFSEEGLNPTKEGAVRLRFISALPYASRPRASRVTVEP